MYIVFLCSFKSFHFKLSHLNSLKVIENLKEDDSGIVMVTKICFSNYFCLFWYREEQILIETIKITKLS